MQLTSTQYKMKISMTSLQSVTWLKVILSYNFTCFNQHKEKKKNRRKYKINISKNVQEEVPSVTKLNSST